MFEIRMPKMGDGMTEGTLRRWLKQVGDAVKVEEPIAEIQTDKADVEMPAEDAGFIVQIVAAEGETVAVGAVIAYLGATPDEKPAPASAPAPVAVREEEKGRRGEGEKGRGGVTAAPSAGGRIKSSPLARKKAGELGVDISTVAGTGGGVGRVVARDVEAAVASRTAAPVTAPSAPAPQSSRAGELPPGRDESLSRMRKAIARRTTESKQTIPHFYLVMPIDMDAALDLLVSLNAQWQGEKVTVNDLVIKACVMALNRHPGVNCAVVDDDTVRFFDSINVGIAVGTDDGLRIPILLDCGRKTLRQISQAARAMAVKTRNGELTPQDMSSGTFTVSNLGMFGIEEFSAIISPPQSAILAVGAAAPEVTVGPDGSFVARRRMRVTLSCDHRTVDGVLGSKFLQEIKGLLESPLNLLA
ncbi:MAG: dihydrolipoamide acetyltransferase family protein [Armatimonadetes bacterium]|nr:dihydrolipoamide acetyltransferase family protein [Armatimonadota bacterium]